MSEPALSLQIPTDDGGIIIRINPDDQAQQDNNAWERGWFDNLVGTPEGNYFAAQSEDILQGIEYDVQGQKEHLDTIAKLIMLLGYRIEAPRAGDAGVSDAPLEGMSTARSSLLSEACVRFWANSTAEFLPAAGPCKVRTDWETGDPAEKAADVLEEAFNHYLTVIASEYYPDTSRMLFNVGGMGCQFKKIYHCPLRKRPVSESVSIEDLIVDITATDLDNAARVTHKIMMRNGRVKKLQRNGFYSEVSLGQPVEQPDAVKAAIAGMDGRPAAPQWASDHRHTIYECYCYLSGGDDVEKPYVMTLDRDSRMVLAVRRDWDEADEDFRRRKTFVKFPYIEALSFYCIGLMHILGNDTNQMTAAIREMLDAGMFASFPGFLYSKNVLAEQNTNLMRVAPGTGVGLETGGEDITKAVMPLPYKDATAGLAALVDKITMRAERVGGTAEVKVAEGNQNAPVGTTLAMIEQAQKPVAAVHKGLHYAFGREFQILLERFREDPQPLLKIAQELQDEIGEQELQTALGNVGLVPASDPNTPSQMQRALKTVGLFQIMQAAPGILNPMTVVKRALAMLGIDDSDLILPPQPPPQPMVAPNGPSPAETATKLAQVKAESDAAERGDMLKAQETTQENQTKLQIADMQTQSKERIAAATLAQKEGSDARDASIAANPPPDPVGGMGA